MKLALLSLLFLAVGCIDGHPADVDFAVCLCKKANSELNSYTYSWDRNYVRCKNGASFDVDGEAVCK